jgi:hypothetical protein
MIEVRVGARVVIRSVYGVIWEVANIDAYNVVKLQGNGSCVTFHKESLQVRPVDPLDEEYILKKDEYNLSIRKVDELARDLKTKLSLAPFRLDEKHLRIIESAYIEYEDEALKFLRKKLSLAVVVERIDILESKIFNSGVSGE